jgi:hypothetical protein
MGKHYNHLLDRHTVIWRSLGKYGRGPIRETLIKELSDEHLIKIIEFINRNPQCHDLYIRYLLEDEVIYRADNNIHVFEYYGDQDPQTGKSLYKFDDEEVELQNHVDYFN